jgi:Uma2 family endonuclease
MTLYTPPTSSPGDAAAERVTPEQMLSLPNDGRLYELVDGRLAEKQMSDLAQLVANNVNEELVLWCRATGRGRSFVEATYQCFPHAREMVRRPDVSLIAQARLAAYSWGRGHFTIAPDLAVEVVSPHDEVYELDRKLQDYFRAGVGRVWVVNPELQIVRIHRAPGDISELVGDAELTDEPLLPGFRCHLPSLFVTPRVVTPQNAGT